MNTSEPALAAEPAALSPIERRVRRPLARNSKLFGTRPLYR
jgi:hypothetical protein